MDYPDRPSVARGQAPAAVPTADQRERVVRALSTHFANDQLSMEEFEERLDHAYKAMTARQLDALLADLPAVDAADAAARAPAFLAPPSEVPGRGIVIALLGANERRGSWIVPRRLKVVAFMGGVELDLREARFGPGVTEIDVTAVWGGVEIVFPPGVRVESFGATLMGSFESQAGDASTFTPFTPVVRLSGMAFMGGVEAKTRAPGETKGRRRRQHWHGHGRHLPEDRDEG